MTAKRVEAAKKSQGALMQHMIHVGWHDKWLRLLLHNIYVRTVLLYGCIVWGEYCVCMQEDRWWEDHNKKLGSLQRKALQAILGVNNDVIWLFMRNMTLALSIISTTITFCLSCSANLQFVEKSINILF